MEITEKELMQIINEEVQEMIENGDIDEGILDRMKAGAAGLGSGLKSKVAGAFGQDTTDIDTTQKLKQASSLMKSYDKQLLKLAQSLKMDSAKMGIEDLTGRVQQAINQTRTQVRQIAKDAPTTARMQRQDRERYGDTGYSSQTQQQQGQQQQQAAPAQQQRQAAPAQQQRQAAPAQQQQAAAPPADGEEPEGLVSRIGGMLGGGSEETPTASAPAAKTTAGSTPPHSAVAAGGKSAKTAVKPSKSAKPAAKPKRQLSQDPRNVRRREKRAAAKAAAEKERARKDKRNAQARARRAKKKASASALSRAPARAAAGMNENKVKKGETLDELLQEISRRWGFDK